MPSLVFVSVIHGIFQGQAGRKVGKRNSQTDRNHIENTQPLNSVKDYFIYLPDQQTATPWECAATSVGFSRVLPGSPYPPHRHPADHHFTWNDGRILHAYQMLFITEGAGLFESAARPRKQRVEAGTVMLLFPEVWHRYAPDPKTGWAEHWIECRGACFDRARKAGVIRPGKPIVRTGLDPDLLHCYERCHAVAQRSAPAKQAVLSTLALQILAILSQAARTAQSVAPRIEEAIQRAQVLISERCSQPINVQLLAEELRVGYSHFRQAFRRCTGVSPKQFHTQVRLQKAQDLLTNTLMTVKDISEVLGFDSPFHLSNQFKARTGLAPQPWRVRLQRRARR